MRYLITLISLFFLCNLFAGDDVNYTQKSIKKEVSKIYTKNHSESKKILNLDPLIFDEKINGKYFTVNNSEDIYGYIYIGRVNSCRINGCSIDQADTGVDLYEFFDYLITYDTNAVVLSVKVLNYQATHGHEIGSRSWLKQFKGYNGQESFNVGTDVDAISGATISVYGITRDIVSKTSILHKYISKL